MSVAGPKFQVIFDCQSSEERIRKGHRDAAAAQAVKIAAERVPGSLGDGDIAENVEGPM